MRTLPATVAATLLGPSLIAQVIRHTVTTLDGRRLTPEVIDTTIANAMERRRRRRVTTALRCRKG